MMNSNNDENCKDISEEGSFGLVAPRSIYSSVPDAVADEVMAAIDAIAREVLDAEFVVTVDTPSEVVQAALPSFSVSPVSSAAIEAARLRANSAEAQELKSLNKKHGFKAQAMGAIDAHRAKEGRDAYNQKRREEYATAIYQAEGRDVRDYTKRATKEEKVEARQVKSRMAKKCKRDQLTPEEKRAENAARSERRRKRRERERAALLDEALF
jgi:hypothetical protein